jgi:hypothetical protein
VQEIFISCVDGLKAVSEAIEPVFPSWIGKAELTRFTIQFEERLP